MSAPNSSAGRAGGLMPNARARVRVPLRRPKWVPHSEGCFLDGGLFLWVEIDGTQKQIYTWQVSDRESGDVAKGRADSRAEARQAAVAAARLFNAERAKETAAVDGAGAPCPS